MQINIKEFLNETGIEENIYPGKRYVHALQQPGEYKSHCVVIDWRDPAKLRFEVKAGVSGRTLDVKKLKHYPVCFQTPTYVDVELINDNRESDKEEEEGKSSSSGGGGKAPAKRGLQDSSLSAINAFGSAIEGKVPELGKIVEMVVLGTQIAADKFANVMGVFAKQIEHAKIQTTELLAQAGDFITKYTPPSFMKPTGDENAVYKYDQERNADIGFRGRGMS